MTGCSHQKGVLRLFAILLVNAYPAFVRYFAAFFRFSDLDVVEMCKYVYFNCHVVANTYREDDRSVQRTDLYTPYYYLTHGHQSSVLAHIQL